MNSTGIAVFLSSDTWRGITLQGSGFRVQGSGFRPQASGFARFLVQVRFNKKIDLGIRIFGCGVQGSGLMLMVQGLRSRVEG